MSKQTPPSPSALRVAELKQNSATAFALRPGTEQLKAMAAELGLLGLRKLSFVGEVAAQGNADWHLSATLGATVVQPCSITLEPVTTRIDMPVTRRYVEGYAEDDAPEVEMPEDDTVEALGSWIDPAQVMTEALLLALPLYPRSDGAELGEMVYAAPGVTPMRDEDARPFAGLAALRDKLGETEEGDG
ncbi:DUF177 domain-containing protein [Roseobacter sp. YSTF-M11]|uniref:DUF177 domain-containing protein n=1 Tax=Roseobacter insulae TaxID=2859783 RepID=A0A9X1FVW6_9RHOB|nr:YceD family protein [Roseobacter insulae]MBW4708055.1 DUF177 domain-containing protein [Roseobacter insulae]